MVEAPESSACGRDFETKVVFTSIISEHGLYCSQGHVKQAIQTMVLLGGSVLSVALVSLQGQFGTKNVWMCSYVLGLASYILVMGCDGLALQVLGVIGLWGYMDIVFSISLVFFNELFVSPFRNVSNVISRIAYASGALLGTLATSYLADYREIISLYFGLHSVFMCMLIWLIPESPSYLLKRRKHARLQKVVLGIARINKYPPRQVELVRANLGRIIECDCPLAA